MRGISIDERAIELARYIIDSKDTVRGAAKKFGISKSTVHTDVTLWNGKENGQVIPKTGLNIQYRVYDFNEFSNLIALKFQQQDQRLDAHDLEIQELQQKNRELEEKINKLLSLNNINQTTIVL